MTLFWRSFLLIALLIVTAVLASFQIYRVYEREPRSRELAQQTVSTINLTRAALVNADPFLRRELLARINAVLRRKAPAGPPGAPAGSEESHSFGNFTLNLATRTLTRAGKAVPLTTGEFSILKVLVQHPRQPLSRDKLMELARGREYEVFDRSIDVQISRLRKIVEDDPSHPKHIQTVWGFGYVFVPEADAGK